MTDKEFLEELKEEGIEREQIPYLLVNKLIDKEMKISTAESCTGGMIGERITSVSGSSNIYELGVISYANDIKRDVLGVDENVLNILGAVCDEVALQMAQGVKKLSKSDIAVSTTGIAGPTGGSKDKPVGLVYICIIVGEEEKTCKLLLNNDEDNDRDDIRNLTSDIVMYLAYSKIKDE